MVALLVSLATLAVVRIVLSMFKIQKMCLAAKPNYVLPNKKEGEAPSGPKPEPGQSKEDAAAAKAAYMSKYQVCYDACQLVNIF